MRTNMPKMERCFFRGFGWEIAFPAPDLCPTAPPIWNGSTPNGE
jgi:hypothetical protein